MIVTREIVSAAELVDHEMNGYIVDAYDESDLAARLDALAASPDLQRGMGEKSFNKSNAYNPEIVADKLAEIYTQEMARA